MLLAVAELDCHELWSATDSATPLTRLATVERAETLLRAVITGVTSAHHN